METTRQEAPDPGNSGSDISEYARALGERLRNVRQQQGLSLHDVERASEGDLKASVVGAYERGERAVSVSRLRALAEFYGVPIAELLPGRQTPSGQAESRIRIDLTRLSATPLPESTLIGRFAATIQSRRGDFNGRVLTLRAADVQAIAAMLDVAAEDLCDRLVSAGIAASR